MQKNLSAESLLVSRSPYRVLGVPANASKEEIKTAYRRLAVKLHPDSGGHPEAFLELQEAYELIGTPEARSAFDNAVSKKGVRNIKEIAKEVCEGDFL